MEILVKIWDLLEVKLSCPVGECEHLIEILTKLF